MRPPPARLGGMPAQTYTYRQRVQAERNRCSKNIWQGGCSEDGGWSELDSPLVGASPGAVFGIALALSRNGKHMAAADPFELGGDGTVRVYTLVRKKWVQRGETITGATGAAIGNNLGITESGKRVVIGAPYANGTVGYALVYDYIGDAWTQKGRCTLS